MEINSNKIINATKWSAITNILSKITPPITNIILARLLTPDVFGLIASLNIVISFADLFADAGFQKYLIQHEFDDDTQVSNSANVAFWSNFFISGMLWIIIFFLRNILAISIGAEGYGIQLCVASFSIPLLAFSSIQQAIYKREFNFRGLFFPKLVRSIIPLVITVPLSLIYRNCWALIIGTLVANVSDAFLLTIRSRWKPKFFYSFQLLKEMFSFSCWTLFESLSIWLSANIDIFIIGKVLSTYYLGLYKVSLTTIEQITSLITCTILPVLFTSLSRAQEDDELFKKTFYDFQNSSAIILIPLSMGILVFRCFITKFLLGNQWIAAADFIGFLGGIQFLRILISYFASEVYRAKGNPKQSFIIQILYLIFLIPLLVIGVKIGFDGLWKLRIISYLVFVFMHVIVLKSRYEINSISMIQKNIQVIIATCVMGVVGELLTWYRNDIVFSIASIIICIIVYFSILYLIYKRFRLCIKQYLKKRKLKK